MRKTILSFIFLLLLLPLSVSAATYYVDASDGNDANNGLSPATAWQTITKVYNSMGMFQPGDQILFQRGETWTDTDLYITRSGTNGNPIIFADYDSGNKPIISGHFIGSEELIHDITVRNFRVTNAPDNGISFYLHYPENGWKYRINIEHCDVDNAGNVGILVQGIDNYTIESCTVSYPGNAGFGIQGSANYNLRNGKIINCTAIDDGTASNDGFTVHDGNYGESPGPNHYFYNCKAYGWKENGFDVAATNTVGLLYRNCESYNNGIGTGLADWSMGYADQVYIENNYLHDCNYEGFGGGGQSDRPAIQWVYAKNVVRNSGDASWTVNGDGRNFYLAHNTFVYDTNSGGGFLDILTDDGTPQNVYARNNILTSRKTMAGHRFIRYLGCDANAVPTEFDYNCYWDYTNTPSNEYFVDPDIGGHNLATRRSTYGEDIHSIFQDPLLNEDNTLQSNSPCIDAGNWLTNITSASGSDSQFTVTDSRWFHDGFGLTTGSVIQLEGKTNAVMITDINYSTHTITLNQSVSWTQGDGIAFAYSGSGPDMGAYEYVSTSPPPPDTAPPQISSFDIQPRNTTSSVNISWTVTDNQALEQAELWRTNDNNSQPDQGNWSLVPSRNQSISGTQASGNFTDTPPNGTFWYRLHVLDNADNTNQSEPIMVIKNESFHIEGDINNDGHVDIYDLSILATHFGRTNAHPLWNATADVVANNEIDIYDVVFVASRFT
jgi:hypothetical protein